MKLNEMKSIGAAAALATLLGTACGKEPSQEELCEDYFGPGSRLVAGACLDPKFPSVFELEESCKGTVGQEEVTLCECRGIKGKIWTCTDASGGTEK
ncbi:MAG: hypothetical protein WC604_04630 [Candidatus Gracilibacteria bacterium]